MIRRFLMFLPLILLAIWLGCIDMAFTLGGWIHLLPVATLSLWWYGRFRHKDAPR